MIVQQNEIDEIELARHVAESMKNGRTVVLPIDWSIEIVARYKTDPTWQKWYDRGFRVGSFVARMQTLIVP